MIQKKHEYQNLKNASDFSDITIENGAKTRTALWFAFAVIAVAAMIAILPGWLPLVMFLAGAFVVLFAYRLDIGLLIMAFFAPFTGIIVDFTTYEWTRGIPYLNTIDAPLVDFIAIVLLIALVLRKLAFLPSIEKSPIKAAPLLGLFGLLVLAHVLSLMQVDHSLFWRSLKFIVRPIIFMYLMFVVLPNSIIKTNALLIKVLKTLFAAGVVGAIMGALSFFVVNPFDGLWLRATPFTIGGFSPFGENHNLLAEVLVFTVPLGVYFVHRASRQWERKAYFLLTGLIVIVALLTFARTAWLILLLELAVFVYLFKDTIQAPRFRQLAGKVFLLGLAVLLPVIVYMTAISSSRLVAGSTSTRWDLTLISWEYFTQSPLVGNGSGAFLPIIEDTRLFALEYGDPLDAHGMIQKVLAENGLLGLIVWSVFLLAIFALLYRAVKLSQQDEKAYRLMSAVFVMVVGAVGYQFLNTSYYNSKMWLPIGLALVAAQLYLCKHKQNNKKSA